MWRERHRSICYMQNVGSFLEGLPYGEVKNAIKPVFAHLQRRSTHFRRFFRDPLFAPEPAGILKKLKITYKKKKKKKKKVGSFEAQISEMRCGIA